MKHKIVEVKNMIKTEQLLDNLLNRSSIVPGIGLIHGPSGFGKTTAVEWLFNHLIPKCSIGEAGVWW